MYPKRQRFGIVGAIVGAVFAAGPAAALSLKQAIATTLETNPQITAASENREAIEFELRQARGLYLPRVDLESSYGSRRLEQAFSGTTIVRNRDLKPVEAGLVASLKLYDFGAREGEVERQASRVDGASFRVLERSEFLALEVTREYLEVLLQARIVGLADENIRFLQGTVGRIRENVQNGSLTDADLRQGEERVFAARARVVAAREELEAAKARFMRLVGKPFASPSRPRSVAAHLPKNIDAALGVAVKNNPRLHIANADIDASNALVKQARSRLYPELFAEGRARTGRDVDGIEGRTSDFQARLVARWNVFNGGIDSANIQEQTRRVGEARATRDQVLREIREAVRLSFDRRTHQLELSGILGRQVGTGNRLVGAYNEQFLVGRRSLLDLLDAQNARFNARVLLEIAQTATLFAEYRLLGSTGRLITTLGLPPVKQAGAYARAGANVPPTAASETLPRVSPPQGKPWLPQGAL